MPITEQSTLEDIAAARSSAETLLAEAKRTTDALRVLHMRTALREEFPDQEIAIFSRNWDQDHPHLLQLLGGETDIDFGLIGLGDGGEGLLSEQWAAVEVANRAIALIGSDDEVWSHLDSGETEHEDWYEFQLPLTSDETVGEDDDVEAIEDGQEEAHA